MPTTATLEYITFGIHSAKIAVYNNSPASWEDIPLAAEGTVQIAVSKADVMDGEGDINYTWRHSPKCTVNLRANKTSLRTLERISGNVASSVAGIERLYIGTEGELTPPLVRLKMVCVAIDPEAASPVRIYQQVILYKCQAKIPDLQFRSVAPGEVPLEFDAYKSIVNDAGAACQSSFGQISGGHATDPS